MNYIRQLLYDMRHQKMMTWVSISGTAVSIFLVLVFFMVNSLPTVEVAPETNRNRIYVARDLEVNLTDGEKKGWSASYGFSYDTAQKLYGDLEGVDMISYTGYWTNRVDAMIPDKPPVSVMSLNVDGNFWNMYNFSFITGRPFTEEECLNTSVAPVVLSESVARHLFKKTDVIDREVNIRGMIYTVVGVIEDVNPILNNSWSEIYLPLGQHERESSFEEEEYRNLGMVKVSMLYAKDTDPEAIKTQLKPRYAALNAELKPLNAEVKYDEKSPLDAASLGSEGWSRSQYIKNIVTKQWLIYALLLLLPAINLSSMMRGRLQHRISEIGVRRAFGAKRRNILAQLLGENLMVTVAGGCIGLLLSYLFMVFLSSSFFSMVESWRSLNSLELKMATPSFDMLFSWTSFLIAIGACFVLNILTASLPAWHAASIHPALAISKSKN